MKCIRTVLGDIRPEDFGVCDFHEHLIRSSGPELSINPWYEMNDREAACEELQDFLNAGGRSMLLMDPIGCGRDVPQMAQIAERFRGKANLVMVTGFHKGSLYDNKGHWSLLYSHEQVVDLLVKEVTEGMDKYSYAGPIVERTPYKAGAVKAGTGTQMITAFEKNILSIVADVQKECGVCISTHADMGTMGRETLAVLKENGADLEKTVICHTNRAQDLHYFEAMLSTGACLCFEGADRYMWGSDTELAEKILKLVDHGYQKQILLGMDAGRNVWQKGYMARQGNTVNGISYLLTDFLPLLKRMGLSDGAAADILIHNPARMLTIEA